MIWKYTVSDKYNVYICKNLKRWFFNITFQINCYHQNCPAVAPYGFLHKIVCKRLWISKRRLNQGSHFFFFFFWPFKRIPLISYFSGYLPLHRWTYLYNILALSVTGIELTASIFIKPTLLSTRLCTLNTTSVEIWSLHDLSATSIE